MRQDFVAVLAVERQRQLRGEQAVFDADVVAAALKFAGQITFAARRFRQRVGKVRATACPTSSFKISIIVFQAAPGASVGTLTTIGLLLMVGACGKSAQIPLYVWLPDAMAGPTPVSALIHAATMVTAGVYMTARSWVIYTHAPAAMDAIAIVGIATAFFAATIGLAQNDIKKVFAYSTVSQLGYMFVGVGSGAFSAGIYHLVTHAFFKALLFLGAGSVIHALAGEQDMSNMGGLRKKIPWTFATMMCAAVAIAGVPPFAGFYSKDAILLAAYGQAPWIYWLGVAPRA